MLKRLLELVRPACPHCEGKGGDVSGYYEPEWVECRCCDPDGERSEEQTPLRVWRWYLWHFNYLERRYHAGLDKWCERESDKMDRRDMWKRIQALEKVAHEPYDFSDIIHRLDKLDGGQVSH